MSKYFKLNGNTQYILSWKSKGLSSESIMPSPVSNNLFNPLLGYSGTKARVKFNRNCLKQSKISYTHGKIVNIYIVYKITATVFGTDSPTLVNCLFGAVTLTKMLILKNISIPIMELDLIEDQVFHFQTMHMAEMY